MLDDLLKQKCLRALLLTLKKSKFKTVDHLSVDGDVCVVTGLFFSESEEVTITHLGPMWLGLWLGEDFVFGQTGEALIPRWMASVLEEKGFSFDAEELVPPSL